MVILKFTCVSKTQFIFHNSHILATSQSPKCEQPNCRQRTETQAVFISVFQHCWVHLESGRPDLTGTPWQCRSVLLFGPESSVPSQEKRENLLDWQRINGVSGAWPAWVQRSGSGHCTVRKGQGCGRLLHLHHGHMMPLCLPYPTNSLPNHSPHCHLSFLHLQFHSESECSSKS